MSDLSTNKSGVGGGRRLRNTQRGLSKVAIAIAAAVVVSAIAFMVYAATYDKIYPGVMVGDLDVGGMTVEQAQTSIAQNFAADRLDVRLNWTAGGESGFSDLSYTTNIDAAAAATAAYETGRDGGVFGKIGSFFGKAQAEFAASVDRDEVDTSIAAIAAEIDRAPVDGTATVGGGNINFSLGAAGCLLDKDAAASYVLQSLATITYGGDGSLDLSQFIAETPQKSIDVDAVFAQYSTGSSEAHYLYSIDETTGKKVVEVAPSGVGYTFDVNQARELLAAGDDFSLPVTESAPESNDTELADALFRDKLAEATTTLNKWNYNRTGNVKLSADAINGTVLEPGEEFSYNKTVGERTYERGYRKASVYVSSGIEDQLGGGICQVSSTLYMVAIRSRLEITHRKNHAYTVAYTPLGEDATVYWGSLDFNFKNNRDYPVKILAWQEDDYVTIEFWGTDVDGYTVEIELATHSRNPYATIQRDAPNLEYGKTRQVVEGHSGYSVTTYAIVKDKDGNQVDRYKLDDSRYRRLDRVLEVGSLGAPAVTTPSPDVPVDGSVTPPPTTTPETSAPPTTAPETSTPPPETAPPVDTPAPPPETEQPLEPATHE